MVHDYGVALVFRETKSERAHNALLDATKKLVEEAEKDGADVLGMRDYSHVTMPELAFNMDVLTMRVANLESQTSTRLKDRIERLELNILALERELKCQAKAAPKPPSNWPLMPHIKRLLTWGRRDTSKP